jgi:hypothetical protein
MGGAPLEKIYKCYREATVFCGPVKFRVEAVLNSKLLRLEEDEASPCGKRIIVAPD